MFSHDIISRHLKNAPVIEQTVYNCNEVMQISLSEVNCLSTISYVIHLDFPLVFALFDELSWGDGEITGSSEVRYGFLKKGPHSH